MKTTYVILFFSVWPVQQSFSEPIRILIGQPAEIIPSERHMDAVFEGLTRFGPNLEILPALSKQWKARDSFRQWTFEIQTDIRDHSGAKVTIEDLSSCMRQHALTHPIVERVDVLRKQIRFVLRSPRKRFPELVAGFRYFRIDGMPPCVLRRSSLNTWHGTGPFKIDSSESDRLTILLKPRDGGKRLYLLHSTRDEIMGFRALQQGYVDLAINPFSTSKIEWIQRNPDSQFRVLQRDGVVATVLLINARNGIFSDSNQRKSILSRLPWESFIRQRGGGQWEPTGAVAHASTTDLPLIPPIGPRPIIGATVRALVSPTTIGVENALVFKHWFHSLGLDLRLKILDRASFGRALRLGQFDWAIQRIMDGDMEQAARDYLHSKGKKNFSGLANPQIDMWIERGDFEKAWNIAESEMIVMRLWYWNNVTVLGPRMAGLNSTSVSKVSSKRGDLRTLLEWLETQEIR